jgi:hypothetical protein
MKEPIPNVLEYFPEKPRRDSSVAAWYVFISPFLVAMAVGLIAPNWALPCAVLAGFTLWYRRRRILKRPQATLRVANSRLLVVDAKGRQLLEIGLEELANVTLDTKSIQMVQENISSGMPQLRFIDSRVGPAIDNSRIELVTADETVVLTEYYTSNIDATDWFSKIRRFLRKNGWRPLAERGEAP